MKFISIKKMVLTKKQMIITGAIGLVTLTGAALYVQYSRLMNYVIGFKKFVVRSVSKNLIVVDLYLTFENKSNLYFNITSQSYTVYLNSAKVITATNNTVTPIVKGKNDLAVRASFNPSQFLKDSGGALGLLTAASNVGKNAVKFDIELHVTLWKVIPISIPFTYETTIAELIAPKK